MNQTEKEKTLWGAIKEDLLRQGNVGDYGFESYISQLNLIHDTGTKLVLEYPTDMLIDWVKTYYSHEILLSAARVLDAARELDFVPAVEAEQVAIEEAPVAIETMPLFASPAPVQPETPKAKSGKRSKKQTICSNLNTDYTFDSFVVGSNSEFAVAAAKAVVNSPSKMYNPLFIHGASGMGKTHLLQAIGNAITEKDDSVQVLYVTSEDFTNSYIDAISRQGDSLSNFRRKYRKADVLIIDDVQFLSQKGKTQEEFFHTFNALFASGKQIILSADCPASEITKLDDRLTSRFEQGLTVALNVPDYETRLAILRKKRRTWKSTLISDEARLMQLPPRTVLLLHF